MEGSHRIEERVKARINRLPGIPTEIHELFYRGVAKRDQGEDMINKAKVQLQRIGKWDLPKVDKN